MQENIITNDETNENQLLIVNIKWNRSPLKESYQKKHANSYEDLPTLFVLDLPENVVNQAKKSSNNYNDVIESFVYNFLTRKFGYEVNDCQIYLSDISK